MLNHSGVDMFGKQSISNKILFATFLMVVLNVGAVAGLTMQR